MSNLARSYSCLLASLATFGCAATSPGLAPVEPAPIVAATRLSLESRPSGPAAQLLPTGARYQLVVADPDEVALLVMAEDGRIAGRLRIRPLDDATLQGSTVLLDDFDGPPVRVDVWSTTSGLRGEATIGRRQARWQVRVDADGSLSGERWTRRVSKHGDEHASLHRAQAITRDVGCIAGTLNAIGMLADPAPLERLMLAELAVELSVRAWEGHSRARLPSLRG